MTTYLEEDQVVVCVATSQEPGKYYTLYTIHRTPYNIHYTLYTIHYTLYTIHYTLYTIHYTTPYTIHHTLYTIHHTLYAIHYTPYTIHHTPYTIHHTLYTTLYLKPSLARRRTKPAIHQNNRQFIQDSKTMQRNSTANIYTFRILYTLSLIRHCKHLLVVVYKFLPRSNTCRTKTRRGEGGAARGRAAR